MIICLSFICLCLLKYFSHYCNFNVIYDNNDEDEEDIENISDHFECEYINDYKNMNNKIKR